MIMMMDGTIDELLIVMILIDCFMDKHDAGNQQCLAFPSDSLFYIHAFYIYTKVGLS